MSAPLTPSKRSHDRNFAKSNGKGKWQKTSGPRSQNQPSKFSPGNAVFRVLFPASRIGSLLGKGGDGSSQIREETGVEVRVEDSVPGCDERIVVIGGSDQETEANSEKNIKEDNKNSEVEENDSDIAEWKKKEEDKDSVLVEDAKFQKEVSYLQLQKALLLVSEKMVDGEPGADGMEVEGDKSSTFVIRLLVLSSQVGCILGKGGSVVKQMSSDSGAQIRILPRDKLPSCAAAADELVQISGGIDVVKKALQLVSQQLIENSPHDNDPVPSSMTAQSSHSSGLSLSRAEACPLGSRSFNAHGGPYSVPHDIGDFHSGAPPLAPKYYETSIPGRMKPSLEILSFRLLCPSERVGSVIGKGGAIIKTLQQETGCEIKVVEGALDSEDRIIHVAGPAHPEDRISPVQDAVFRVQARIVKAVPDGKEQSLVARLLVSSNQIGCLLGKGGSIIAEMRKSSGAYIRILGKEQVPKCAGEDEEVVQINGEPEAVQDAMLQITTRLRHHFFRDAFPSVNYHPNPPFMDRVPPFPSYLGRRELSPPGIYSNLGPSFRKFDAVGGIPSLSDLQPRDDHPPFHRLGAPHLSDRKPWSSQGLVEGGVGLPDFAGAPHRRIAGFGGGNHPAIITSTTVEVVVPRNLVPILCGENGECLKQIREISDAKITITEPKQGAVETVIIISGTPEQTHAAQSLIQAFVISETESS